MPTVDEFDAPVGTRVRVDAVSGLSVAVVADGRVRWLGDCCVVGSRSAAHVASPRWPGRWWAARGTPTRELVAWLHRWWVFRDRLNTETGGGGNPH